LPGETMTSWTWQDIDAIALALAKRFPDRNPLMVQLRELRELVARLPEFRDVPGDGTEKTLEAIQAAWYEEYES